MRIDLLVKNWFNIVCILVLLPFNSIALSNYSTLDRPAALALIDENGHAEIPDSYTSIGADAFKNSNLKSVTIPDTITNIGDYAFSNNQLTSVELPNSVISIEEWAFAYNSSLESLTLGNSIQNTGYAAFWSSNIISLIVPDSVTLIDSYSFYSNQNLESITIGNSVTSIGYKAFKDNNDLQHLVIGSSVTNIGAESFMNTNIDSLVIPESVTSIDRDAFRNVPLSTLVIGSNVTSIGDDAFNGVNGDVFILKPAQENFDIYNFTSMANVYACDSLDDAGNPQDCEDAWPDDGIDPPPWVAIDNEAPVITSGAVANAIDENSGAGQVIYTITATDINVVSFSLGADSDPALSVDSTSGEVTLSVDPDYEVQSDYAFTVIVTDAVALSSQLAVSLSINDVDEYVAPIYPEQSISVTNAPKGILGKAAVLEVSYDTGDSNNQLTGIGMRVHFNSSLLSFKQVTNLLEQDIIVDGEGPFNDEDDFDNDPLTDQYISFGWASLFGNWPNVELPAVLMNIAFDVSDAIDTDTTASTHINFSHTALASGYQFESESYNLELVSASWDFDGNGQADALTDGLIMLRYCFGLRGETLVKNVMSSQSTMTAEQVEAALESAKEITDIDNDGSVEALTDGLILLRYLFDLNGDSLTMGVIGPNANRTSNAAIEAHLEKYMPKM
jgi:hypothetical protein